MALGWLAVLKNVPWGEVIDNAPKVAQGAKKLWGSVGKKVAPGTPAASTPGQGASSGQDQALAALQAQVAELHQQMLESSALIQSLADQNTQLIARIELQRKRLLALATCTLVLGVALVVQYFR
jgi:hypothetical protein